MRWHVAVLKRSASSSKEINQLLTCRELLSSTQVFVIVLVLTNLCRVRTATDVMASRERLCTRGNIAASEVNGHER